ncbi:DUF975 family protein [Lactobacillaceae bacterium Melli_B4]
MQFATLKNNANQEFGKHFKFYFILFLPYLILITINGFLSNSIQSRALKAIQNGVNPDQVYLQQSHSSLLLSAIIGILAALLLLNVSFHILNLIRHQGDHSNPFAKSTSLFSDKLIWGIIGVWLLQLVLTILWAMLLIVPGIIKSFSYSQAIYIYRDAYKAGHPISAMAAITKSRQMMDGHKGELFLLQFSFIGWYILLAFTTQIYPIPFLGIYVYPYFQITMMEYYDKLNTSFNAYKA